MIKITQNEAKALCEGKKLKSIVSNFHRKLNPGNRWLFNRGITCKGFPPDRFPIAKEYYLVGENIIKFISYCDTVSYYRIEEKVQETRFMHYNRKARNRLVREIYKW